jgi:hypothetical protein
MAEGRVVHAVPLLEMGDRGGRRQAEAPW